MKTLITFACLALSASLTFAPLGAGQAQDPREPVRRPARPELLRSERPVLPGAAGGNRLEVDVPLLVGGAPFAVTRRACTERSECGDRAGGVEAAATGGLSDLRFYDRAGREVPYLLVDPPSAAPRWANATLLPVARTDSTSAFEADLGSPRQVDRMRVLGLPAPFLKRVRLEGSGDRQRWTLLVAEGGGTLFDLPAERLRQTELEFTPGEYRYLRLTWDDRNSGRVPTPAAVGARLVANGAAAPTLRTSLWVEKRASEPRVSRYRVRLPGARLPIVALELSVGGGNVLRNAKVSEARLAGGQVAPFALGAATLRRTVREDGTASSLRIPIAQPTEAALDLVIDDGDNPPLDITGVTAIFATLPYIHFDIPATDTLTARFGGQRIAVPRYDLEAVRERVPLMELAAARWGEPRESPAGVAAAASSLPAMDGAPIDVRAFRWQREIPSGPNGLTAVPLDARCWRTAASMTCASRRRADDRCLISSSGSTSHSRSTSAGSRKRSLPVWRERPPRRRSARCIA